MKANSAQKNIPDGWRSVRIRDVAFLNKKSLGNETPENFKFKYIDLSSVDNGVIKLPLEYVRYGESPSRARRVFKKGDILMATVRPNLLGHCIVNFDAHEYIGSTGFAVIENKKDQLNNYFLFSYLFSKKLRDHLNNMLVGSSYPAINSLEVANLKVDLPPLPEQNRIVAVLETWDRAIEKLARKIEVKKNIKMGLMQELLTGKTRLPGFKGVWEKVELEKVMLSFTTGLNPRDNFLLGTGNNFYVTIKNISQGRLDFSSCERIDDRALGLINKRSGLNVGDIIMASIGNVGDAFLVGDKPKNWDINESVFCLKPNPKIVYSQFVYYIITSQAAQKYFSNNITGSSFRSIKMKELRAMPINLIPLDEQRKIVDILLTIDRELSILERKLGNFQDQKKYLLNNLITGAIRTPEKMKIHS